MIDPLTLALSVIAIVYIIIAVFLAVRETTQDETPEPKKKQNTPPDTKPASYDVQEIELADLPPALRASVVGAQKDAVERLNGNAVRAVDAITALPLPICEKCEKNSHVVRLGESEYFCARCDHLWKE